MKLIPFKTCNGNTAFINPLAVRCVKLLAADGDIEANVSVTVGDYEAVCSPTLTPEKATKLCDDIVAAVNEALAAYVPGRPESA